VLSKFFYSPTDIVCCLFSWQYNPLWLYFSQSGSGIYPARVRDFLITHRRVTVGRIPLDEWSILRREPCLTTHTTHNRQTSMPPMGFETTISAGERPKTYALDRAVTGTGIHQLMHKWIVLKTILKFTLKLTLKQLRHVSVQSHHH
jgi:hypothetical protein